VGFLTADRYPDAMRRGIGAVIAVVIGLGGVGAIAPSATAAPPPSPIGSFDAVAARFDNNRYVSGWAADADALDQPIAVRLYLGGAFVAQVSTADPRPDVAARMHGVGQNTGWHATITPAQIWTAASGTVMCAYAINVGAGQNNTLGCHDLAVPPAPNAHNPRGNLEQVTLQPGLIRLRGWAGDPDTTLPTRLRIYYDGYLVGSGVTKRPRPDVAAAGLGPNAGFDITLPITQPQRLPDVSPPPEPGTYGQVHVCVYAENGGALGTDNATVGCAQRVLPGVPTPGPHDPVGTIDPGSWASAEGWAYDPDASTPVTVILREYILGSADRRYARTTTGVARPDVFAAHPDAGPNSGFQADLRRIPESKSPEPSAMQVSAQTYLNTAWWYKCAYLQNISAGANRFLGCRLEGVLVP
jgi:hypothetical protein